MNTVKRSLLTAAAGILAMILLAGCFNPAAVDFSFPEAEASGNDSRTGEAAAATGPVGHEPFEVTIYLDAGGGDRKVLGPDAARITGTHIRNFIQVFLLDKATNTVVEIFERRREKLEERGGTIVLSNVALGNTYKILMLQGHWERDYDDNADTDDNYVYDDTKPPTLLYAGLAETKEIVPGTNEVELNMYPILVDTKFTSPGIGTALPALGSGAELIPGEWNIAWTVKGGPSGINGFTDLETAASGRTLFKATSPVVQTTPAGGGVIFSRDPSDRDNTITLGLGSLADKTTGSANFNLTYVPFSLNDYSWPVELTKNFKGSPFNGIPQWIIRNGVNDETQNSGTTFTEPAGDTDVWNGTTVATKNGNGAVAFEVKEEAVVFPEGIDVYEAYYVASTGSDTAGTGTKAAPFATVQKARDAIAAAYDADASWPGKDNLDTADYAAIVILNTVTVSTQIVIDNSGSIYPPILLTDGSLSSGGTLQATRAIGHQNNLLKLQNGARVTLAGGLVLAGLTNSDKNNRVRGVYVDASVFTMAGGKISGHFAENRGGGVYVDGGTFILSGGEVTGNKTSNFGGGGGVYVKSGTFILSDNGAVRDNETIGDADDGKGNSTCGGGVWITAGTFTMKGGEISGNDAGNDAGNKLGSGGGVYVDHYYDTGAFATFTMEGGTISGNTGGWGGGVIVHGGDFTMSGGTITGNTATKYGGGGVAVWGYPRNTIATMTGGEISGNIAGYAAEVLLGAPGSPTTTPASFIMSGDAQPTRVFLSDTSHSITIGATLTTTKTYIDLAVDEYNNTITSWVGTQILINPARYYYFSLGQTVKNPNNSPVESSLSAYRINNLGEIIKK